MKGIVYKGDEKFEVDVPIEENHTYEYSREIWEIKEWFDKDYAQHEQKYNRLIALDKLCDDGTDPKGQLIKLYEEAEIKRRRIQELEKLMEG